MTYVVRKAKRSEAKPLIGIYAESGRGKTYSALLLARGFVGPSGRIIMIETESGRGEAYADPNEYPEIGGYDVISMRDNFSPEEYGKAISVAEAENPDALIIDSASHEWDGVGGVLDMAEKRESDGKKGMLAWQKPKIDHQKHFMLRFMQTPIPLVVLCMRAKYPMVEVYNPKKGKKEPVRSDKLEPKQSDDILYEMFVHGWIDENHVFNLTKSTSRALDPIFSGGKPLSAETGAKLKAWAAGGHVPDKDNQVQTQEKSEGRKLADRIKSMIDGCNSPAEIFDLIEIDLEEDFKTLKAESVTAHDYLKDYAAKKKKYLEVQNAQ